MATRPALHRSGAVLVGAVLVLTSVGCASEPHEATAAAPTTTSSAPTTTTTPTPTPEPEPILWPLTGVETITAVQRPALAVKIENSAEARPQTGLNAADIVWEQVVEGGITRLVAVYHSALPPEIGPVRSVRPMDAGIAGPLHGVFAFSGGQAPFVDAVRAAGLQVISQDSGAAGYYRTGRRAPHNIYADPTVLIGQADPAHAASPAAQFVVAPAGEQPGAATGTPTSVVDLRLSPIGRPSWTWSAADSRWVRAERGVVATEADGTPLRAVNVVVLRVDVVLTPFTDSNGTHVPETVMVGGGQALIATGGRTVAATWSKASVTAPVVLTGADGQPIRLAPGNTWVELVPNGTGAVTLQ